MAGKRAQDRVTAAKVREKLARRRQVEEAVLVEAAAALDAVRDAEQALTAVQDRRSQALGTVAWLLPEAEAASVLGVSGQALRAAKRRLPAARAQQLGAGLGGTAGSQTALAPATLHTRATVDGAAVPGPVVH